MMTDRQRLDLLRSPADTLPQSDGMAHAGGTFTVTSGWGHSDPVPWNADAAAAQRAYDQAEQRNLSNEEIDSAFRASQARSELRRDVPGRWWPIAVLAIALIFAAYLIGTYGGI